MKATILVVRPEPGLAATMAAAKAMDLNALGYPLFDIEPREWSAPDADEVDALLIGSANAIRHGGAALEPLKSKPVHAVGQATADAAREAGFEVASVGIGGLQMVLDAIPAPARLLRIAGADHVPLTAPAGVTITTQIAYEAVALELPEPLRALQELNLIVLLHSAAAAEQFARESRRLALDRSRISLATIGPRVAEAAGTGWRAIHVCEAPSDRALLEMTRDLCI
ncbi:uroporphyrinogen-III synthase [uncultured Erythrobacter sp.]|uniref:uroporphyrinogen-III synthase n=1 Tax=uncultured Erythrobacter sp. TaxID=263913 RepID=UPI00262D34D8|nr:uroporphyrinogen-III synthase [uncultured Erythrobacter sp.]